MAFTVEIPAGSVDPPKKEEPAAVPKIDVPFLEELRPYAKSEVILPLMSGGITLFNLGVITFLDDLADVEKGPIHTPEEMKVINLKEPWRKDIPLHHWPIGLAMVIIAISVMATAILLWLIQGGLL